MKFSTISLPMFLIVTAAANTADTSSSEDFFEVEELDADTELGYDQDVEMAVSESSDDGMEMEEADDDGRRLKYRTRRQGLRGRRGYGRRQGGRRRGGKPRINGIPGTNSIPGTSSFPGYPPPGPVTPPLPTNYCSGGTWCTIFSGGCVAYTFGTPVNPSLTYCPSGTICFDPMTSNQCIVW